MSGTICGIGYLPGAAMRHCFASGFLSGKQVYGIGIADSMQYCGSSAALHGYLVAGVGKPIFMARNCFFTGSLIMEKHSYNTNSSLFSFQNFFVENCYVAPSKYSSNFKTSFLNTLTPQDSFPVRHCYVSSNVTIPDSSYNLIHGQLKSIRLEITKLNDADMKLPAFVANLNQYDGSSEWQQDTFPYRNNGYPLLRNHFAMATATTLTADSVTDHSARLHARFFYGDETINVKGCGIEWKKQNDTLWQSDTNLLEGGTLRLENLEEQTTYLFRGYITRSVGKTTYGEELSFTTKKTIAVKECGEEPFFTVSPVPAADHLTVTGAAGAEASLYNTLGQKVLHLYLENNWSSIDVSGLPCGSYLLQVRLEGKSAVRKVQVQR